MSRKPYRIETVIPKYGKPKHYLVKDVAVANKRRKYRKYIGIDLPNAEELDELRAKYAFDIEYNASLLKAKISGNSYITRYLTSDQIVNLESCRFLNNTVNSFLTTDELQFYKDNFEIEYIQGTTSIEGNTLSLEESIELIKKKKMPEGKELREIYEVQNFKEVIKYRDHYRGRITINFIKKLHSLIMNNLSKEPLGSFRSGMVFITGSDIIVTPPTEIENELHKIVNFYYKQIEGNFHPFEEAVMFHYFFEIIHPFQDGNGRVGREIFNFMLAKQKYPRLLFLGKDRDEYLNALKAANYNDYKTLNVVLGDLLFHQRLENLKQKLERVAGRVTEDIRLSKTPKREQKSLSDFYFA